VSGSVVIKPLVRVLTILIAASLLIASCACDSKNTTATGGPDDTQSDEDLSALEKELADAPKIYSGRLVDDTLGDMGALDLAIRYDFGTGMAKMALDVAELSPTAQALPLAGLLGDDIEPITGEFPYGTKTEIDDSNDDIGPFRGSYQVPGDVFLEATDIPIPEIKSAEMEGKFELDGFTFGYKLVLADGNAFTGGIDMLPNPNDFECGAEEPADPTIAYNGYSAAEWSIGAQYSMAPRARVYLDMLGWDANTWNQRSGSPVSYGVKYDDLGDDEQEAADELCITPDAWDVGAFPYPVGSADQPVTPGAPTPQPGVPTPGVPTPGVPTPGPPAPAPAPAPAPNPATATVIYGKTCYGPDGHSGTFEVLFSSSAPSGAAAVAMISSSMAPSPRRADTTAHGNGDLLFTVPVYGGPGEVLYLDSLTVDGVHYTVDFGSYTTPPIDQSCVEEYA
jgi:hypothetical protein